MSHHKPQSKVKEDGDVKDEAKENIKVVSMVKENQITRPDKNGKRHQSQREGERAIKQSSKN